MESYKKVPIFVGINSVSILHAESEHFDITWEIGKKSGKIKELFTPLRTFTKLMFETSFKKSSNGSIKEKALILKFKCNKNVVTSCSIDMSLLFYTKNRLCNYTKNLLGTKGEEVRVDLIYTTHNIDSLIHSLATTPRKALSPRTPRSPQKPLQFTITKTKSDGLEKTPIKQHSRTSSRSTRSFGSLTMSKDIDPYIEQIVNIENYRNTFKTRQTNRDIMTCDNNEENQFSLLSLVLLSMVTENDNQDAFNEALNILSSREYPVEDLYYIFISVFECAVLLKGKNEEKRVESWKASYEMCCTKSAQIADKVIETFKTFLKLDLSKNGIKTLKQKLIMTVPNTIQKIEDFLVYFAVDLNLFEKTLEKDSLSMQDGNDLLMIISDFDKTLSQLKLCTELSKLLMIDNKKILTQEDIRMAICPHITADIIEKVLLKTRAENTLTDGKISQIRRMVENQVILDQQFSRPFFKVTQIKNLVKHAYSPVKPFMCFDKTPFAINPLITSS
ncbi:hypothetical protein EIN_248180 [Entamoeba invadens IP1]|uniref:Uncharacterized protein n=1 Tax=Entamoeba invadens IP1 TaxID=370355 RepID=A0A0A1UGF4_ENTIV|nr:hypothetical protein EIN_248180 [Entamoeba invadens IP1]ELP94854.1 hypothetical protein EIN_248180 [Entamoeba invadens IP1]|eukprot:XP_004261625.1 hypothetical protein EIN_248180 [Entamoeba invadens IP1]